ncbi:MAG TPA: hypothetical protein H9761_14425 [Candidatus Eisenbergiella merdavium]|uniref:Uncharacterized protein n=1 Tax=Candidatus Eisenbergiella merdavium TaxID=2838551 RepID=A0A9D2NHM8_9FIRM|nr:hypothetical protein [Candidatus Eisenbergiella merdavium]
MKSRKNACRLTSLVLCGALLAGSAVPALAAEENTPKDENVYVNLNQDGSVDGIYVVNAYRLDTDTQIVDYGNYESVKNLTSDGELLTEKGRITVDAQAGDFFYQGNLQSKEIPWEISIGYTLDGKKISASELAGRNGRLKISVHVGQNDKAEAAFFENYLLQVTLTMDMQRCSNLEAPGATAANVGTDKQLVYSILAGSEKDITVTADVLDFEMDAISFQGLPMNLDVDRERFSLDDLHDRAGEINDAAEEFSDGAQDLSSGVSALQEGAEGLKSGAESLKEGIDSYADGARSLGDGINTLQDGTNDLADGAQELVDGIYSLADGANRIRDGYSGENGAASGARKLADGVKELKAGSHQLSDGVSTLIDMISGMGKESTGSLDTQAERLLMAAGAAGMTPDGDTNQEKLESLSSMIYNRLESMIGLLLSGMPGNMGNGMMEEMETETESETETETETETESETETETETETESETETETETESEMETETELESETEAESEEGTESETRAETETSTESEDGTAAEENAESEAGTETGESTESEDGTKTVENAESESGKAAEESTEPESVEKLSASIRQSGRKAVQELAFSRRSGRAEVLSLSSSGQSMGLPSVSAEDFMNLISLKAGADQLLGAYEAVGTITASLASPETLDQLAQLKEGAAALDAGIGALADATGALADGIGQLADGTSQLADGVAELADGGSEFADGTKELADGVSDLSDGVTVLNDAAEALSDGSAQLADGTGELLDGSAELADGVADLKDGTDEFKDKAGDIDAQIDEEVDGVINDLTGNDFEPVSFVSDKNTNVELVQFVMQTEEIRIPEETDIPVEEEPMSFWRRLLALFRF